VITPEEADMRAAALMLERLHRVRVDLARADARGEVSDAPMTDAALVRIEQWLRRRALGGDKVAIRRIEKELGHQVRMRGGKKP